MSVHRHHPILVVQRHRRAILDALILLALLAALWTVTLCTH